MAAAGHGEIFMALSSWNRIHGIYWAPGWLTTVGHAAASSSQVPQMWVPGVSYEGPAGSKSVAGVEKFQAEASIFWATPFIVTLHRPLFYILGTQNSSHFIDFTIAEKTTWSGMGQI